MKKHHLAFMLLLVAACQNNRPTGAQSEYNNFVAANNIYNEQLIACINQGWKDADATGLREAFNANPAEASNSYVKKQDKKKLAKAFEFDAQCRDEHLHTINSNPYSRILMPALKEYNVSRAEKFQKYLNGKITVRNLIISNDEAVGLAEAKLAAIENGYVAQLNQWDAQEKQQRRQQNNAAWQALAAGAGGVAQGYQTQQQQIQQQYENQRPVHTSCYGAGNSINCWSSKY